MDICRGDIVEFSKLTKLIAKVLKLPNIAAQKSYKVELVEGNQLTIMFDNKPLVINYMLVKKVESGDSNVY